MKQIVERWGNGDIKTIYYIQDGKIHGRYKSFWPGNILKQEGNYIKGKKTGMWKFYEIDGRLVSITFFKDNLKNGIYKRFFPDGKMSEISYYINNKLHGLYISYYRNGNISSIETFIDGKLENEGKSYWVCGKIWSKCRYKNGRKIGKFETFSLNNTHKYSCYFIQ